MTVLLLAASAAGSLYAAAMAPSSEGSAAGLLVAGAVLVGIGRFRRQKQ